MAYIEHNTSINATNVEYELLKWDAILQKLGIDLRKFNYKFTLDRRFNDTIKDSFLELGIVRIYYQKSKSYLKRCNNNFKS